MTNIPNTLNNTFKIIAHKKLDDEKKELIIWSKTVWVNKDVELSAQVDSEYEINEVKWYKGYDQEYVAEGNSYTVTVDQGTSLQQVYKATATVKETTTGEIEEFSATIVISIDKINPSFFNDDASNINDKWQTAKNYNIKAYDNQSNIYGYTKIDNRNLGCPLEKSKYSKKEYMKISANGTYNICAIDNAGNTTLRDELKVDHIDNVKMDCEFEIIGNKVDGNQWYIPNSTYPQLTLKLKSLAMGPSGVQLGISTENKGKYTSDYINTLANAFVTTKIDSNKKGVTYYGFVRSQSGNNKSCSITLYYEHSITAPKFTSATSTYDTITAMFDTGSAISGISEAKCYLTDANGNVTGNGTLSGNNCNFTVPATSGNTKYYFKKCITSKAGNTSCSTVANKDNVGYCTAGNYTTKAEKIANTEGSCSKKCGTGTRTYKYKNIYTSNYNSQSCGTSGELVGSENCNTQGCCSKTNYTYSDWGTCSQACDGGTQTRTVTYTSAYDGSICSTGAPAVAASTLSQACNTQSCLTDLRLCTQNLNLSKGTGGVLIYTNKVDKAYTKIEYQIKFTKIEYANGHCDIQVAAKNCGACNTDGTVGGSGTDKDGFAPAACPVATWNNVFQSNKKTSLFDWSSAHSNGHTFTGTITLDNSAKILNTDTNKNETPNLKDYHIRVQCFAPSSASGKLNIDKANSYIKVGN